MGDAGVMVKQARLLAEVYKAIIIAFDNFCKGNKILANLATLVLKSRTPGIF